MVEKNKPSRLLGFVIKTFTLFLIGTSLAYFIWLGITAPYTYSVYPIHAIVEMGMVFILPISFLLEAISIVIYGIYRIKLKAGEIFLCSWYISVFVIFVIYAVWLILYPPWAPPPEEYIYPINPSGSLYSGMTAIYTLLLLSLLPAAICTIVYIKFKKPQVQKPT